MVPDPTGPDLRLLRAVERADQERAARIKAERVARALRMQISQLRVQLRRASSSRDLPQDVRISA
jgi:hypothetical protein